MIEKLLGLRSINMFEAVPIESANHPPIDKEIISKTLESVEDGCMDDDDCNTILDAAGITKAHSVLVKSVDEVKNAAIELGWPLDMYPTNDSFKDSIATEISDLHTLTIEFERLMRIDGVESVKIEPHLSGIKFYYGAKRELDGKILVLCGCSLNNADVPMDVVAIEAPINFESASNALERLRAKVVSRNYVREKNIIIPDIVLADIIRRLSALMLFAPRIERIEMAPVICNSQTTDVINAVIRLCTRE